MRVDVMCGHVDTCETNEIVTCVHTYIHTSYRRYAAAMVHPPLCLSGGNTRRLSASYIEHVK